MSTVTSKQKIITGVGLVNVTSDPIMIDLRRFHFGISIICTLTGVGSYGLQVSGDPQEKALPTYWNNHDILSPVAPGVTVSANTNLAFPATFVRLFVNSLSGTLVMSVIGAMGTS